MALIICPECGRQISDRAAMCIGCGISMEDIRSILSESASSVIPSANEETLPEINSDFDSRIIKCIFCNESYSLSEYHCPKCENPALNLSKRLDKIESMIDLYKGPSVDLRKISKGDEVNIGYIDGQKLHWTAIFETENEVFLLSNRSLGMMTIDSAETALKKQLRGIVQFSQAEYEQCIYNGELRLLKPSEAREIARYYPRIKNGVRANKHDNPHAWWLQKEGGRIEKNPAMSNLGQILENSYNRSYELALRPVIVLRKEQPVKLTTVRTRKIGYRKKKKVYFKVNGSLKNPMNKLICTIKAISKSK